MRLSVRLALVFGTGSLLAVSSVAAVAGILTTGGVIDSVDDSLRSRAEGIAALVALYQPAPDRAGGPPGPAGGVVEQFTDQFADQLADQAAVGLGDGLRGRVERYLDDSGFGVSVYDDDGALISGNRDLASDALLEAAVGDSRFPTETVTVGDQTFRVLATDAGQLGVDGGGDTAVLVLYEEITTLTAAFDRLWSRLALVALGTIAALTVAGWLVGRWLARPLDRVTSAAETLARLDDLPGRIEIHRDDEVGRLADAFNRTLSALEVGREQQRRLVADASHELRTPLTSVRVRMEFLAGADELPAERRRQMVGAAVADLERLSALVSELVDLAADVRSDDEDPVLIELRTVLVEVASRSEAASLRPITVDADDTRALVRPGMIRRAVQNLVDNAVKYSPDGSPVRIRSRTGAIDVIDEGAGIAPEDRALVFDRFYRSPRARSRPGSGIGLAVVKQVAEVHGGEVWADTGPGSGARVGFSVDVTARPGA